MAEQIKFGDRLYLKGEELVLDNGSGSGVIKATSGTVEIKGNLVVTGDTTTVNSIQTSFADPKLLINGDLTGAPSEDVGIEIERGTSDNKFLLWNETTDKWSVGAETFVAGIFEGNLTGNVTGDITSSGSTFSNIDINGGAIDGTIIGANTPAAGTFSTVTATTITGALTGNVTGTVSSIANHTTSDLTEGTNLYYTDARVDARYATLQADSNFIETLDGQNGAYYLDYNNLTNVPTVIGSIDDLSDVDTTTVAPTTGQTIIWNGTNFVPGNNFSQSDFDSAFTAKDTDDLSEGTTNLYHTTARARASISATGSLSYDSATGVVSYTQGNTDTVAEGSTNLYYTDARADARVDAGFTAKSTTDLSEGTNLYYTDARADTRAQLKIDALIDSSPGTLDTLNELAAALGDDPNFATTMTTSLAGKEPTITAGTTSQYWRGDKSFQTLDTLAVAENTNLYYTDARARASISATGSLSYNSSTGVISFTQGNTDTVAEGTTNLYYTTARANTDFDTRLATKSTTDLAEGTNLYYTDARVQAVSINDIVEDTTPQLGGNLDLNTYDLSTTDPTVSLTTTTTPVTTQGTVGSSTETNLSNTTVTVNDDGDYANAVSSFVTLSSTEIDNLGFEGEISLSYFGSAASTSNFVFRDASDSYEQNNIITVYSPPTDEYTFTLATHPSTPINSADADITFKQYAYGEMTVTSSTALSGSTIQLRDADGFYIDKNHVTVTSLGGTSYKIVFWTHSVSSGDVIDVIASSAQTAVFEWGTSSYSETGLVATAESFSLQSSTNDIFAMGDLEITTGSTTGEVVGTLIYDSPTNNTIISGLTTVTLDGTGYQSALTVTEVPIIMVGNSDTSTEVGLAIGTGSDARIHQLDSSGDTIFKFPAADGTANQVMKTDGSGDISWQTQTTDHVTEGSNLYYTDARADARAQLKIDALVDSAPGTLDTLNELATALGDDANFSTTMTNSLATKLAIADFNSTFDTRLGTKTTSDLTEGTNLYYTDARARASISATGSLSYNSTTGVISFTQGNTDTVTEGSSNLYYTDARARSSISASGDLSYNSSTGVISFTATASPVTSVNTQTGAIVLDTDDVAEGTSNLYYTDARARSSISVSGDISYNSTTGVISTTGLASSDTDDLSEGTTNLYYTDARAQAVSINNIVEDTTPQLGGTLDLNTFDLTTLDDTVTLTTNATPSIVTGTVGSSTETLLSNTTVTVNDDGDYANSVSSFVTLTSTQIDTLGFKGDSSLTYFGSAASSSNFVFRDTGDSVEQNSMIVTYSPPTDTYTFTLASQHADNDGSIPGNQNQLNISAADTDIKFKQYAYGEMTVSSSTVLTNANIQLRDEDGFYIDKAHVDVTNTSGTNYKIVFWTHAVSSGDTIEVVNPSSSTAIFTWGAETYNETGLVASSESFSISSSSNDIIAIGDLDFTAGNITGEVVGTLVYDKPSNKSIVSGLTTVSIDGTDYQSALTVSDVPVILSGNSGTSNEVSLAVGTGADGRIHQLDSSGNTIFKFPAADGSANQIMKTDGSGDISWTTQSTDYVTEGSNLYYTDARADARAQLKIDALIGGASSAFDTLLEIENAMATDTELSSAISGLNHDTLSGFVANEHIDWTQASAGTIDPSNYSNTGDTTYTAGTGLSLVGTEFSNTAPDQTVTLTGAGATSITGTYPNFTITSTDTSTNISGTIEPATDNTYNLGSPSKKYANIYGHSVHATYADLAERYATDVPYEPGTVVIFGGEAEITTTLVAGDVSVAGVISTNPAIKLNADAGNSVTHPYVALRGRVPCNMVGPVSKGDLIITAHDEPGYAKSNGKFDAGRSVFAKSLETDLTDGKKVIEVVIL